MNAPPPFRTLGDLAAEAVERIGAESGFATPRIERATVKPIRADFAFVDLRLPGVALYGLEARRDACGRVSLAPPTRQDRHGRTWPLYALQPGVAEAAAAVVTRLWDLDRSRPPG